MTWPAGWAVRPAGPQDLDAVVDLFARYDAATGGAGEPRREFLTWVWGQPWVDLDLDTRVAGPEGSIAAYAHHLWDPEAGGPTASIACVDPAEIGKGAGSALVDWMEERARTAGAEGTRLFVAAADAAGHGLMEHRGYACVRTSWDMTRPVEPGLVVGEPPPGISITPFAPGADERTLYEVSESAFADHWGHRPTPYDSFVSAFYEAEDWDPSLAFLARSDGRAVGELVALEFQDLGYVASVGVERPWRGRGIARALLMRAFGELAARGQRRVELTVDATNPTGAVALYRRVGMAVRSETHIFEKPSPAG